MKNCELQELSRAAGDRPIAAFSSETAGAAPGAGKAEPVLRPTTRPRARVIPVRNPYDLAV